MMVVGTGGSVGTGAVDELEKMAAIRAEPANPTRNGESVSVSTNHAITSVSI